MNQIFPIMNGISSILLSIGMVVLIVDTFITQSFDLYKFLFLTMIVYLLVLQHKGR